MVTTYFIIEGTPTVSWTNLQIKWLFLNATAAFEPHAYFDFTTAVLLTCFPLLYEVPTQIGKLASQEDETDSAVKFTK